MSAEAHPGTCACGCAVAAWSMPWPDGSGGTAPWTPTPMHEEAPGRAPGALFPVDLAEEMADPDPGGSPR